MYVSRPAHFLPDKYKIGLFGQKIDRSGHIHWSESSKILHSYLTFQDKSFKASLSFLGYQVSIL